MPLPKQKTTKQLQSIVDKFNTKVKVGDKVQLKNDQDADWETVTVSNPATVLGGHTAVGWFEEKSGCYSLDFVKY